MLSDRTQSVAKSKNKSLNEMLYYGIIRKPLTSFENLVIQAF